MSTTKKSRSELKSYVDKFLALRCAPDVLGVVGAINNTSKEISESMALIGSIRDTTLKAPMEYSVLDLASGNSLTSVMSAFMLPLKHSYAVDIKDRNFYTEKVQRWSYNRLNMYEGPFDDFMSKLKDEKVIVIASHPCTKLALRVVDIFKSYPQCKLMAMLPCCIAKNQKPVVGERQISSLLGRYHAWAYHLAISASGDYTIDERCTSPCRAVVTSSKDKVKIFQPEESESLERVGS